MKINIIKYLFLALFYLSCFSNYLIAQSFNFSYFNVPEGLPQSSVNAIYNDSRGYLWIATTGGGVAQFDGKEFICYSEKNGLAGNVVTGIAEDNEGNMWFTSTWGGISKFNGRKMITLTENDGLNSANNHSIFVDTKNRIWIGNSKGITIYENGFFKASTNKHFSQSVNFINSDKKGNIWVGSTEGLIKINEKDTLFFSTRNNLPSNNVTAFLADNDGDYYIGFKNKGIYKIISGSISKNAQLEIEPIHENLSITSIIKDNDKNSWFSTKKNGIFRLNSLNQLVHVSKENGLETNEINLLYKDRNGNLWLGSNGAGLIKLNLSAFTSYDNINGLNKNNIFGISDDNDGNLWVVTSDDGVFKYDGKNSFHYKEKDGLGSNNVKAVIKDNKGNLWFATNNGLTKYTNGIFKNYTTSDGIPSNQTKSLLIDVKGNLWIGTNGGGLVKYNYQTFKTFTEKNGLSHNYIHSLFEDSKGNIWIGTGNGINKLTNETFISFSTSKLCNPYISSITEDKYGIIWFGSDRCLTKYDGIDFRSFTTKNGLSSEVIYLVHFNKRGNLWVGTNNGIDKIGFNSYGQIENIKNYGFKEGFKGVECNSRAIYEDKKSNLWIGTVKGLIKYSPTDDRENVFESKTHITNVKLFFEPIDWLKFTTNLTKWDNLPINIELNHNQNHLSFEFNSINLTQPKGIMYSFILEGFDKDWGPTTTKDVATYSNLPPGNYTFKVKSRNNDGVWNQEPATFSFSITPPFWKTWWFYILAAILTFYTVFKISSIKEKRQLEISRELEFKVKERTLVIEKQRDEKEVLLKEIHHRVKNNMQVINSLLSIQSSYTKDKNALALFSEAQNRIRSMALIHEKMYQSGDLSKIDFEDYIVALTNDLISTYSINKEIKLDLKITPIKFGIDTLIPIGLLLNEIISNTLKYAFVNAPSGTISIYLNQKDPDEYELIIGDNGIGMQHGLLQKEDETLGIELIKVFVTQVDGEITHLDKKGTYYKIIFKKREKK
ncbi:MAG: hypothetical protein K0B10_00960 [Vicingaceae bacterium]|nr:hypothetical protein [Vicingaceae bacterium]